MEDAPVVPDLHEYPPAARMDRLGNRLPRFDVSEGIDARRAPISLAAFRDRGCLGDDQGGARPLAVVLDHQLFGDIGIGHPAARQRRHDNAMREAVAADGDRLEPADRLGLGCEHGVREYVQSKRIRQFIMENAVFPPLTEPNIRSSIANAFAICQARR
jgi:hypothetical protein